MKVSVQYAETHLPELISAAYSGQEVEIAPFNTPALRLVVSNTPATTKRSWPRILGAGRGEIRVPSDEEWRVMDKELENEMLNAPLTTNGEV